MANRWKIQGILRVLFCALPLAFSFNTQAEESVVIYHPSLKDEDFSSESLIRIYAMQKKVWSDGTPVRVFRLPSNEKLHKAFVIEYLHMQPYQLNRLWHRLVFSGTGTTPQELPTVEKMRELVLATEGAIGYIDKASSATMVPFVIEGGVE